MIKWQFSIQYSSPFLLTDRKPKFLEQHGTKVKSYISLSMREPEENISFPKFSASQRHSRR